MLIPFIRTIILYLLIIVAIRFMGKRQVGEMQPAELVITILISAVASVPMQDISIPMAHGVVPILALIAAEVVISTLSLRWGGLRRALSGNPITVIEGGVLDQKALKRLRMSIDDVLEDLRLKGVFDLRQVRWAQIETNGQLSVLLESASSPPTAKLLGLKPEAAEPFHILIADGRFSPDSLRSLGRSEAWMDSILAANGAKGRGAAFLLAAQQSGGIIFALREH